MNISIVLTKRPRSFQNEGVCVSLLSFIRLHIINRAYNSHYHKSNSEYQRNRPLAKEFSRSGNDDVCNDCCNADYDLKYSGKQIPFFRLLLINFGNLFALQIGIYLRQ